MKWPAHLPLVRGGGVSNKYIELIIKLKYIFYFPSNIYIYIYIYIYINFFFFFFLHFPSNFVRTKDNL